MDSNQISRRTALLAGAITAAGVTAPAALAATSAAGSLIDLDPIKTELVMNLVVTCSSPERMGPSAKSKDGVRDEIWPIIGGKFEGPNIRGTVIPGGGDFPLVRPDGVVVVDALYRLKTDDGATIIIHNKGIGYPPTGSVRERYRLVPEFIAPEGRYDWLNKSIFLSTLVDVPTALALARGPNENDRLIQVHRVL